MANNSRKPESAVACTVLLGRRIYACLSACATLEAAAHDVLLHRQATGEDDPKRMELLDSCRLAADKARQDADVAMHELGIGYHQIYGPGVIRPKRPTQRRRATEQQHETERTPRRPLE